MSRDRDMFVDVIESWLAPAPGFVDADAVLQRVITDVETAPQRRLSLPLDDATPLHLLFRIGLAGAVVLAISLLGLQLVGAPGVGGPAVSPPPPASPTPTPTEAPAESALSNDCFPSPEPPYSNPASTAPPGVGFIGLPPLDAIPSTPEVGELVECYPVNGQLPYEGMVRLYADGRLIWLSYYDDPDSVLGHNARSTGYLEQRLTPEGVRMIIDHDDVGEKHPLRLADWLPASAWHDQTIRPYVPSGYAACLLVQDRPADPEPNDSYRQPVLPVAEKLAMLPAVASALLSDELRVPGEAYDESFDCLGLTTAEARELDTALRDAGLEQDEMLNRFLLEYHLIVESVGPEARTISIWFEPLLPDGTFTCSACG